MIPFRSTLALTSLVLTLVIAAGTVACKHDDAKKAALTDAGSDEMPSMNGARPPVPSTAAASDAGSVAVVHDAGSTATTATTATATHDAGSSATGTASTTATATATDANGGKSAGVFDRFLVKPSAGDAAPTPDEVKQLVEEQLHVKIVLARKSAAGWMLLQFAPAPNGRTAAEQSEIVEKLKKLGVFESVEADRLMKVR